jgi:hypothetical protein
MRKGLWFWWHSKLMSPVSFKKTSCAFNTFIQSHLQLCHFSAPWKKAKIITLLKPGKDQKFCQNLHLISLLSTRGKLSEKTILRTIQRHTEERNLLNVTQFGFWADHRMTLQCIMWGWWIRSHLIPKITCQQLLCSWISRKLLAQHNTLACLESLESAVTG